MTCPEWSDYSPRFPVPKGRKSGCVTTHDHSSSPGTSELGLGRYWLFRKPFLLFYFGDFCKSLDLFGHYFKWQMELPNFHKFLPSLVTSFQGMFSWLCTSSKSYYNQFSYFLWTSLTFRKLYHLLPRLSTSSVPRVIKFTTNILFCLTGLTRWVVDTLRLVRHSGEVRIERRKYYLLIVVIEIVSESPS